MLVSVGTFNLNNLFSRYNFKAEITSLAQVKNGVSFESRTIGDASYKVRTYKGRLVKKKDPQEVAIIAERIKRIDVDVLAVQEVEDRDTLDEFSVNFLDNMYPFVGLIEGNDPRLIDVGVMSKLPIGAMTSWQHTVHPDDPEKPIFSRDVLEVEILNPSRRDVVFTLFNNHLKSHFVDFRLDPTIGERINNTIRQRQAEMLAQILRRQTRPDGRYIVLGDMNDAADSVYLSALTKDPQLALANALTKPVETQPFKEEVPTTAWTHRFKASGKPAQYELYDHIWLSSKLAEKREQAVIDRRTQLTGDGSDHDPAWVILKL